MVTTVARAAEGVPSCELHVWPAAGMHSTFVGWVHGSTVDGAAKGKAGYPQLPADPIAPADQLAIITARDAPARLDLVAGTRTIDHPAPLDRRAVAVPARHEPIGAPCYAELIVDQIFHEESVASPRTLRVLFRFRSFGDGDIVQRGFTGWGVGRLPPRPDIDSAAVTAAFKAGFAAAFDDFAVHAHAKLTLPARGPSQP